MMVAMQRSVERMKEQSTVLKTIAIALGLATAVSGPLMAAGGDSHVEDYSFSFEGPFGKFDQDQLQRGLLIYQEVCSACHGLKYVPLRTLGDEGGVGLSPNAVKGFASTIEIFDAELDDFRPAIPTDHFPANDSVDAPDLSLMTKARSGFSGPLGTGLNQFFRGIGGTEYVASVLTGYTGEEKEEAGNILYQNTAYPGGWTSMAPPLVDGIVEFPDGSPNGVEDLALDVTAFLTWAAEPKMMARKYTGLVSVALLILLSALLYLTNKRLWAPIKHRKVD